MDKKLARYAKQRRVINKFKDFIWFVTKQFRKAILIATGIGGVQAMEGSLGFKIFRNGIWYDFGCVGHKVITTAFATFIVTQLQTETSVFGDFKFHQIGTGTTAESAAQTVLITPVESVTTGSQTSASAKVYKSVASISITNVRAITEHGLFNNATPASGTLMDRTLFSVVNLVSGDTFEATYQLTVSDNT